MPYHICGGKPLSGEVRIQGSKNSALPILAATLLVPGKTVLHNCPNITDVSAMLKLLSGLGCVVGREGSTVIVNAENVHISPCSSKQVRAMRSSIMLLGSMLARCGSFAMEWPGGCEIGKRPIDMHIDALRQMNVLFEIKKDGLKASTNGLCGCEIHLPFPSVGATENILFAAITAKGQTILENAAKEPEIVELCNFLNHSGAKISGIGTQRLVINGLSKVESLKECEYSICPDRIVAGTYMFAAAATKGTIRLLDAPVEHLTNVYEVLRKLGCDLLIEKSNILIRANEEIHSIPYIKTAVYPGFPTDLQSMLTVCLTRANGKSVVEEDIFENRFQIVDQLWSMGALISVQGSRLLITGVPKLQGTNLTAKELRGGAALILAALSANGESIVKGSSYINRGYENIVRDLCLLGANIGG